MNGSHIILGKRIHFWIV